MMDYFVLDFSMTYGNIDFSRSITPMLAEGTSYIQVFEI